MPNKTSNSGITPISWFTQTYRYIIGSAQTDGSDIESALENTVRSLVREIEQTCQLVVTSCAIANAGVGGITFQEAIVLRYFPERPKLFPAVLHGGSSLYLDRDTATAFSNLYSSAALAAELSSGANYSNAVIRAEAWRTTALHASWALRQACLLLMNTGVRYRITEPEQMIDRLEYVAKGGVIGINPDGTIASPGLEDGRRHIRYLKTIPATVVYGEVQTIVPVMIRDISRGGCGFDAVRRFVRDVRATVVLNNLSRFEGKIVWASGLSAGLQFDELITEAEAMFAGEHRTQQMLKS